MKNMFFGLLMFFATGVAHAYTAKGSQGCGVYVADFDKDGWEKIANGAWLVGVITGYNYSRKSDVGKGIDIKSIELYVYNYCKKYPLSDTAEAAEVLIYSLKQDS